MLPPIKKIPKQDKTSTLPTFSIPRGPVEEHTFERRLNPKLEHILKTLDQLKLEADYAIPHELFENIPNYLPSASNVINKIFYDDNRKDYIFLGKLKSIEHTGDNDSKFTFVRNNNQPSLSLYKKKNEIQNKPLFVETENKKSTYGGRKRRWSMKYKKSINCKHPKGFSQKNYCKYGRKRTRKTRKNKTN